MVYKTTYNSPKLNKREVFRYASISSANERDEQLLSDCLYEAERALSYKICYKRYPISLSGDELDLGFCRVISHSLSICLADCSEILLFCATIGGGIDRLIEKSAILSPARMVMMSALGSERVESLCDEFCKSVSEEEAAEGRTIRPRFSPGYGDLSIKIQKDIFSALNPEKHLGVYLDENFFMSPSKSVTAIIGIKKG